MIKLTKGPTPEILISQAPAWTDALLQRISRGEKPTDSERSRYRHPDVKAALIAETHAKCAYCESKLRHITHGDIDHIVPKSTSPEKAFEWDNLTLACDLCNEKKGAYFGRHEDLVDPYAVEPAEHLIFVGPLVIAVPGSNPGMMTETILNLNRPELVERRQDKVRYLSKQFEVLARISDESLRSVVRKNILEVEAGDVQEYAALARSCISILINALDRYDGKRQPAESASR